MYRYIKFSRYVRTVRQPKVRGGALAVICVILICDMPLPLSDATPVSHEYVKYLAVVRRI
jgi:hypothetical protein